MKEKNKNKSSVLGKRSVRAGGYSTLISLVVVAVVIAVNLFVSALPANLIKIDTSAQDLYTLTDETKTRMSALAEEVNVYLVASTGTEDALITELLDRYKALSSRIKVQYIDPVVRPTFVKNYTNDSLDPNSIIVESARRSRVIPYTDILVPSYGYDENYNIVITSQSFNGENAITAGIDYVTTANIPIIYTLSGHTETALSEIMAGYIDADSMEVKSLSLIQTGAVPDDADCILINNPVQDITESELDLLRDYVSVGGNLLLLTTATDQPLENLSALMAEYGTIAGAGVVIETDSKLYYPGYEMYLMPSIISHATTDPIINAGRTVFMPLSQGIIIAEVLPAGVSVVPLLSTSDKAYLRLSSVEENEEGEETEAVTTPGPFSIGVAITAGEGKVIWFSSAYMINDEINSSTAGANSSLFLNALGWLTGKESSIKIRSISLDVTPLIISEAESNIWTVITCVIIPLSVTATGLVVWTKRRKR